jgi:glutathione S-transferase
MLLCRLFFQTTGQGPYYGQAFWFERLHSEKVQSAIDRYVQEMNRVTGVLEVHLTKQKQLYGSQDGFDGPWLVGNKLSYVDLAFVPWQMVAVHCFGGESGRYKEADYPLVTEWLARLKARKTVTDAMQWLSGLKGDGH